MSQEQDENCGSWIVTIRCVVIKSVVCDGCTERQAREETWKYSVDEDEVEMIDWEVKNVEENK